MSLVLLELALLFIGMFLITLGVAMLSVPAALVVGGLQLLIIALWPPMRGLSRASRRSE